MSEYSDASLVLIPSGVKEGKLYSQKPLDGTGDFTVVRNSDATYVDKNGIIQTAPPNVARIDHTDGGCGVLLTEPQSTNSFLWSEQFDNSIWGKSVTSIIANQEISPNGNLTADKILDNVTVGNNAYTLLQPQAFITGNYYNYSIYVKNIDRKYCYIRASSSAFGTNLFAYFDIELGSIISASIGISATITPLDSGWFKITAKAQATGTGTVSGMYFGLSDQGNNNVYINPISKGFYIWGAKFTDDKGSYIPTQGTTVTRIADSVTGAGDVNTFNSEEGTLFVEMAALSNDGTDRTISISDGTAWGHNG